jgi:hypothetical protein
MNKRHNELMAADVRTGIHIDYLSGSVMAWAFMDSHHVPTTVILRVLCNLHLRRKSDLMFHPIGKQDTSCELTLRWQRNAMIDSILQNGQ